MKILFILPSIKLPNKKLLMTTLLLNINFCFYLLHTILFNYLQKVNEIWIICLIMDFFNTKYKIFFLNWTYLWFLYNFQSIQLVRIILFGGLEDTAKSTFSYYWMDPELLVTTCTFEMRNEQRFANWRWPVGLWTFQRGLAEIIISFNLKLYF